MAAPTLGYSYTEPRVDAGLALTFWKVAGLCNKVSLISHRDVVIAAPTIPFDVLLVT